MLSDEALQPLYSVQHAAEKQRCAEKYTLQSERLFMNTQEFGESDFKRSVIFDSVTLKKILTPDLKWGAELLSANSEHHFTCSAIVFNQSVDHVLLFAHRKYGFWVYPGGHANSLNFQVEVLRELNEELGILATSLKSVGETKLKPTFFMKFYVKGGKCRCIEQEHVHYDAVFGFTMDSDLSLKLNTAEGLKYSWFPVDLLGKQKQLHGLDIPEDTVFAVKKMLDSLS